jgi:hypothetical protein
MFHSYKWGRYTNTYIKQVNVAILLFREIEQYKKTSQFRNLCTGEKLQSISETSYCLPVGISNASILHISEVLSLVEMVSVCEHRNLHRDLARD